MEASVKFPNRIVAGLPHSANRKGTFEIGERIDVAEPVRVKLTFYKKDRVGDLDNRIKPVVEALEAAGMTNVVYITASFRQSRDEHTIIEWGHENRS